MISSQAKTQAYFKTIEAGDLAMMELIYEAMAVFGFTKAGKTTSCHILSKSNLRSQKQNGALVYQITNATGANASAKIGNTNESET